MTTEGGAYNIEVKGFYLSSDWHLEFHPQLVELGYEEKARRGATAQAASSLSVKYLWPSSSTCHVHTDR